MADETTVVKDDKGAATTSASTTDSSATTPVVEKTTAKTSEAAVPYDRFQEVIKQKNSERQLREQYEARIKELESNRMPSGAVAQDKLVKRLVDGGMKPEAAQLIAETAREANRETEVRLQAQDNDRQVNNWTKEIERNDPDYSRLKPHLEKAFDLLSDKDKRFSVSSPQGLEWFYNKVKLEVLSEEVTKARAEGVKQGYEGKSQKEGMASDPKSGSNAPQALSFESIRSGALKGMTDEEYKKRLPEINAILAKGPSRK